MLDSCTVSLEHQNALRRMSQILGRPRREILADAIERHIAGTFDTLPARVLAALLAAGHGGLTTRVIAQRVEGAHASVATTLGRLLRQGQVEHAGWIGGGRRRGRERLWRWRAPMAQEVG